MSTMVVFTKKFSILALALIAYNDSVTLNLPNVTAASFGSLSSSCSFITSTTTRKNCGRHTISTIMMRHGDNNIEIDEDNDSSYYNEHYRNKNSKCITMVQTNHQPNRRHFMNHLVLSSISSLALPSIATAAAEEASIPDRLNVDNFLKTGMVMNPMGVSGQAGKSKPITGILLREGSEVSRDSRTGDVLAEIVLQGSSSGSTNVPVLASFVSPWPLASGTVFDVECRNPATGDGAFLAVSTPLVGNNINIQDIPDSFFVEQLFTPTGRFSSYGTPTDIKVRKSSKTTTTNGSNDNYRIIDISFSTLSQSTQTELPRRARVVATIPDGTKQVVMLIGSASLSRWNKSSLQDTIYSVTDSFRAIPAPSTSLKLRAKERRYSS